MKRIYNTNTDTFKIRKNKLNGQYMVYSDHPNLMTMYHFSRKDDAQKAVTELNAQALNDAKKYNFKIN